MRGRFFYFIGPSLVRTTRTSCLHESPQQFRFVMEQTGEEVAGHREEVHCIVDTNRQSIQNKNLR